jgi:hypothetical protein
MTTLNLNLNLNPYEKLTHSSFLLLPVAAALGAVPGTRAGVGLWLAGAGSRLFC